MFLVENTSYLYLNKFRKALNKNEKPSGFLIALMIVPTALPLTQITVIEFEGRWASSGPYVYH
ncbi:hypothetical protein N478_00175 [Pseudoalteromonas luteoviolacea S4060-1]|uniref:Uncharacterized protein n=1 Tax=Pseudoalteromonas luteoviolacea S4060-1 TaxID=1365257 RepID=A0A167PCQ0_9GAMM|nr:hypothetical protein N478_00175 [Pseudoalteromonas luteoviolacea S4060-1]